MGVRPSSVSRGVRLAAGVTWVAAPIVLFVALPLLLVAGFGHSQEAGRAVFYAFAGVVRAVELLPEPLVRLDRIGLLWTGLLYVALWGVGWWERRCWLGAAAAAGWEVRPPESRYWPVAVAIWPTKEQVFSHLPDLAATHHGRRVTVSATAPPGGGLPDASRLHWRDRKRRTRTVATAPLSGGADVEFKVLASTPLRWLTRPDYDPRESRAYETGDATFDDRFEVTIFDSGEARPEWLLDSAVREALLAVEDLDRVDVDGSTVEVTVAGRNLHPAALETQVAAAAELAGAIENVADTGW